MRKLFKILSVLFAVLLLVTTFSARHIDAAGKTLKDVGIKVEDSEAKELTFDRSKVDATKWYEGSPVPMEVGKTYTTVYPQSLDYFGKILTVQVDATLDSTDMDPSGINSLSINDKNRVATDWTKAYNTKIDWKVSFFDSDGKPYAVTLLFGFRDPDESNYLFDTSDRALFYIDAGQQDGPNPDDAESAALGYAVKAGGLYRVDKNGNEYDLNAKDSVPYFLNAVFFAGLNNETSFEFRTETFSGGSVNVPVFYSLIKEWKITYDLKDSDSDVKADNSMNTHTGYRSPLAETINILEPKREGYKFLGWTREDATVDDDNDKVQRWDVGDKHFIAAWEAEERDYTVEFYYMDENGEYPEEPESTDVRKARNYDTVSVTDDDKTPTKKKYVLDDDAEYIYEEKITPEGETVLKVYFKRTYTVTYKPGTQGVFDDQVNPDLDYGVDTPEFEGTPKGNPGYSFVGWDETPADRVTEDAIYVAVWEPWKYYIEYDANGGKGIMDKQTFTYSDDTMTSKPNEFTRSGYRFTGFKYEHNGDVKIVRNIDEFRDLLVEAGPGSSITLVAQWERIPEGYSAPVTGVE